MDTTTASRSSRPPLRTALIAVVALLALAACSSSESTSTGSGSPSDASEDVATNDVATNDVATSTEVSLTLEFDQEGLEELRSTGASVLVAREVEEISGGQVSQLVWLSVDPLEMNQLTFDPGDIAVFASDTQLEVGALIAELAGADISDGGTATWNNGQFDVASGSGDTITVVAGTDDASVFGLAGSVTVNGRQNSTPYVAANVETNETVEFSDTGRIIVWVASMPFQPGTVSGPTPPNATTIDIAAQPNATLTFNEQTQTFDVVS